MRVVNSQGQTYLSLCDMKILALKWRQLGDGVLWTPALEAIVQHYPGSRIDLAYPKNLHSLFKSDGRWTKQFLLEESLHRSHRQLSAMRSEQPFMNSSLREGLFSDARTVWSQPHAADSGQTPAE